MQTATATKGFTTGTFNYLSTKNVTREQQILEPDDDFYRAISMDEFKERARIVVENAYKRYTNERNNITGSIRIS